jgi:hypothetical protein
MDITRSRPAPSEPEAATAAMFPCQVIDMNNYESERKRDKWTRRRGGEQRVRKAEMHFYSAKEMKELINQTQNTIHVYGASNHTLSIW